MSIRPLVLLFVMFLFASASSIAQVIHGDVIDRDSKNAIRGVSILNIYTNQEVSTNDKGEFSLEAASDQLVEFKKQGYKTVRVRVPKGFVPSYFKIIIEHGSPRFDGTPTPANFRDDYYADSIRFHDIYKHELNFARMSTVDKVAHPFSAMSKASKEIWRFQTEYEESQQEKFVDHYFTEELVTRFTGLSGDSLKTYMIRYRPSYEQIRSMNEYMYYSYIKKSVQVYRSKVNPRNSN